MQRHFLSSAVVTACMLMSLPSLPALAGSIETTSTPASASPITTQLPRSVRPTHYAISLTPDAASSTFSSSEKVTIQVVSPTNSITLNAVGLTFQQVSIQSSNSKAVNASKVSVNAENETATFEFAKAIAPGTYTLSMAYSGTIGTQANGLFSVDYPTPMGQKRAIYTQFEASDARRLFASWDEPAYKATFSLEVTVPNNEMAVSNMPVVSKIALPDGRNRLSFATTPKMSTYLLFFALGDFERATDTMDGTELGVITQKGNLAQAAFPLAASKAILKEYNNYFGVPYPLPKLDNVAAPGRSQFFSAMENWGAIFTFEHGMLLDPAISTQSDKERSFSIVAHEMAHQWFGDLVTMRWWDDLWLNEGFASWMESRTTERLHPEWSTKLYTVGIHDSAMEMDSLSTTHPIVQQIATVEQASQAFDGITYQKGESIIRMLENYVGADTWRKGVRDYMQKHAYGNTSSDDLWHAIEKASAKPIARIAHDFTLQPGIPLIKVDKLSCKDGVSTIHLTQSEFSRDQANKKPLTWHVPVTAQLFDDATKSFTSPLQTLVSHGHAILTMKGCGPVIINAGQTGYFRTLYTHEQFTALASHFASLSPIDQLGLLSDSWALGLSGIQPIAEFLNLANATPISSDPQIWSKIASDYESIYLSYQTEPNKQQEFSQYAIAKLTPVMALLSWRSRQEDSTATLKLREHVISVLGQLGDKTTIAEANRRYTEQASNPADFPVELRKAILGIVALHADEAMWNKLRETAQAEKSAMKKDQLYSLLASTKDVKLATRSLDIAITEEPGATNSANMIEEVARLHPDLAFDFAIAHLSQINQFVDGSSRSRYIPAIASRSAKRAMIDKLKTYADTYLSKSALGSTNMAIASINYQIQVRKERLPAIASWLSEINKFN